MHRAPGGKERSVKDLAELPTLQVLFAENLGEIGSDGLAEVI